MYQEVAAVPSLAPKQAEFVLLGFNDIQVINRIGLRLD